MHPAGTSIGWVSRLEDEMHMTEVETHKARKAHRCEWCWQRIDEGTEYKRYRYLSLIHI